MRLEAHTTSDELLERAQDNDLVWLVSRRSQEQALHLPSHIERFTQEGWFHCRSSREAGVNAGTAPLTLARNQCWIRHAFNSRMISRCLRLSRRSCATASCACGPLSAALMKLLLARLLPRHPYHRLA